MCQTDPPNKSAKMSCHENLPDPPARMTRQIYLPEIPPSPLKSPGRTWLANLPPPPQLRQRSKGGGARSRPGPPVHLEQVLLLFSWMITYSCITRYIHILYRADWTKYKYIAVGEGKVARRGWGAGLLPAPLKGVFCVIWILQEVSRHAILTRIGYENIYNIPLYSNEYISA